MSDLENATSTLQLVRQDMCPFLSLNIASHAIRCDFLVVENKTLSTTNTGVYLMRSLKILFIIEENVELRRSVESVPSRDLNQMKWTFFRWLAVNIKYQSRKKALVFEIILLDEIQSWHHNVRQACQFLCPELTFFLFFQHYNFQITERSKTINFVNFYFSNKHVTFDQYNII